MQHLAEPDAERSSSPSAPQYLSTSVEGLLGSPDAVAATLAERIIVAVRKRPRLGGEMSEADVVQIKDERRVVLKESKVSLDGRKVIDQRGSYTFDFAFDETCSNARIYVQAVKPTLDVVRRGGNAVFFAFGQTGSGKTHTMMGSADGSEHGLYVLAARDIIGQLRGMRLSVTFYEIYGSKLFDLLNGRSPIQTLEDENKFLHLVGLTEHPVLDHAALMELMAVGASHRASGSTHVNDRSSRSHAVLTFIVRPRRETRVFSRISFIDLAGSERAQDTHDLDKKTRAEGAEINKSLLALKECIRAMHEKKRHIPFRGSKLTQILRDSFAGNCTTVMFANVSPCLVHSDDTLNTLKYTDRIKELGPGAEGAPSAPGKAGQSVEPDLCEKCGFPILLDDRSLHVCPKQYVPCKFCKLEIVKSKMQRHLQECLEAPVACPDCGLRGTRGQITLHADKCPNASVECVHCHMRVPKKTLDSHIGVDCPAFKLPCTHCRALVPRRDAAEHAQTCAHRQVPCASCGFLVKHSLLKEHLKSCVANQRQEFIRSVGKVPPTPSRLPPLVSPRKGNATPQPLDLRTVPSRGNPHLQPMTSASTARRPSSKQAAADQQQSTPLTTRNKPSLPALGNSTKRTAQQQHTPKKSPKLNRNAPPPLEFKDSFSVLEPQPPPPLAETPRALSEPAPPPEPAVNPSRPPANRPAPIAEPSKPPAQASPCRLGCNLQVKADDRELHEMNECANAIVACPFGDAGCADTFKRSELVFHIESSVTKHLMLVHSNAVSLRRENEVLREKLARVEHRVSLHAGDLPATSRATPPRLFTITPAASEMGTATPQRSPVNYPSEPPLPPTASSATARTPPPAGKRDAALFHLTEKSTKPPAPNTGRKIALRPPPKRVA